jgi:hypothetical protein
MAPPQPAPRFRISLRRLAVILSTTLTALTVIACVALKGLTAQDAHHSRLVYEASQARQAVYQARIHLLGFSRASELILVTHDEGLEPKAAAGTTFRVRLPVAEGPAKQETPAGIEARHPEPSH